MIARHLAGGLALLALAGCAAPLDHAAPPYAAAGGQCRVGPDGGPLLAESGIGGTGISAGESGIGGTGVVGVITGFASICISGLEVAYDATVPVQIDGAAASAGMLRAGNVAIIEASRGAASLVVSRGAAFLVARRVAVQHEVVGPVEAVEGATLLRVAGQPVLVADAAGDHVALQPGDWAAVSGLRRADQTIIATRIERRPPGLVIVHGRLEMGAEGWRLAGLAVQLDGLAAPAGSYVVAVGRYQDGALHALALQPDGVATDPAGQFGPDVTHVTIESYISFAGDRIRLGPGAQMPAGGLAPVAAGRAVIELERGRDGEMVAAGIHAAGPAGAPARGGRARAMPDGTAMPSGQTGGGAMSGGAGGMGGPGGGQGGMGGPAPR